jgi:AcrR family transcriptional regulator
VTRAAGAEESIVAAAERLIGKGTEPTVAAVTGAAGVSRSTFYRTIGSHRALLDRLDLKPDPAARERILAAAVELIGAHGLTDVSMEQIAARAQLSRASVYRLFPGKSALFKELIEVHSPVEAIRATLERHGQDPPEVTIPALVEAVNAVMGHRPGLVRALFIALTSLDPDTDEGVRLAFSRGFAEVISYVVREMGVGRLRPMHPIIAIQSLVGSVLMHLITRGLVDRVLGDLLPTEEALRLLADNWLRAMQPEREKA